MLICSIFINTIAAVLFFYELRKQKEEYPAWEGKKIPVAIMIFCIIATLVSVGLSVFITGFYSNTFLFTLKRVIILALLWPIIYTDFKAYRIPNLFILAGLIARAVVLIAEFIWARDTLLSTVIVEVIASVALFFVAVFCTLIVKNGIGGGDMKLFIVMGLFLGVQGIWSAIFLSLLVSFIVAVALLITKKKTRKDAIPFGPAIAVGTYLSIFLTGM